MSVGSGNYPPLGTHDSDGFRSGSIFTNGYEVGSNNGVLNSGRFTWSCRPSNNVGSFSSITIPTAVPPLASGYLTLNSGGLANVTRAFTVNNTQTVGFIDVPFGRYPTVYFSAATLVDATVTVWGFDYGGYPVTSTASAGAGAFQINLLKAFAYVSAVYLSFTGVLGVNVYTGFQNTSAIGMPYYFYDIGLVSAYYNGLPVTSGIQVGSTTNPSTASSSDPRGSISVTSIGTAILEVDMFVFGAQPQSIIDKQVTDFNFPVGFRNAFTSKYGVAQYSQPLQ
jgi:hypothetical protein